MVESVKPIYVAKTKEEFEYLEKSMDLFLKNYGLKLDVVARVNVEKGFLEKTINIFPKGGKIEEILIVTKNPKGILRTSTPEYTIVKIGEYQFMIRYRNPDEKKASG